MRGYVCAECGHRFHHIPILSNISKLVVCIDPAPTYGSLFKAAFKSPVCPKCGSKTVQKRK